MRACFSASPHSCKYICFSSQPSEGFSEGGEEFGVGVVLGEGDDGFGIVSQEGLAAGDHRDGTGGMGCHHNGHQHGQHHYFFHLLH